MVYYKSLCNWERYLLVIMIWFLYFYYTAWRTWLFVYCAGVSCVMNSSVSDEIPSVGAFNKTGGTNRALFYTCWSIVWNILFVVIVWLPLRWLFCAASLWIWNLSIVLRWVPFFWTCNTCIMLCMFPKVCPCSIRCCAYFELWLFYWKDRLCSLYLVWKSRPVCPTYNFPQSGQVNL
jgi:hypothetical protein